jgi:hypothetical protein
MLLSTSRCGDHGHADFVLEFDEQAVSRPHAEDMIQTIEDMVARGSVFAPGETIQIGWMITQVRRYDESRLTLFEPDMRTIPMAFLPGVTETLRQMMLQLFFIDSLAIPREDMSMPNVRQSVITCGRYAVARSLLLMRGKALRQSDSGWFISCLDQDHDHEDPKNLVLVSLYDAFLRHKPIQGWMAFPSETLIALRDSGPPQVFRDGKELAVVPNSFLARALGRNEP